MRQELAHDIRLFQIDCRRIIHDQRGQIAARRGLLGFVEPDIRQGHELVPARRHLLGHSGEFGAYDHQIPVDARAVQRPRGFLHQLDPAALQQ
jgi:hypothetical protein